MKKEYRNSIRTKKIIKQTFIELLGEKAKGEYITVGELSERADIAKSTFYNHYNDIYDLVEEFENELIDKLCAVLDQIETEHTLNIQSHITNVICFMKQNEEIYRRAISYTNERYDVKFFIEKLKSVISRKIFEENTTVPFSTNTTKRQTQIRFLTNACVDTMVDYFRGTITSSLDEVGEIILDYLNKLK